MPIHLQTVELREYTYEENKLTETQAYDEASRQMNRKISELLEEAEILSTNMSMSLDDGVCRMICEAICITDIAQTKELQ